MIAGTGWGEGPLAVQQVAEWIDVVGPWALAIVAFMAGYIVGGIVQRG